MDKQPKIQPPQPAEGPPSSSTPAITSLPKGARVYVSMQGDMWDMIAIRVYGAKRGNEHLMYRLLEENYYLRNIVTFPAGIPVVVPMVDIATEIPLVPWKSATLIPNT